VPYNDYGTALLLAFGIMAALYHRKSTGEGQLVEGSLLATALMMMNSYLLEEAVLRLDRPPQGNRGAAAAPGDLYRCKGGKWVLVQVGGNPMFKRWCKMVGKEEWFTDPRFTDDLARGTNGALLNDFMQEWCSTRTKEEVLAAMEASKIPGSVVLSPLETLDDPHVKAMKYLEYISYPGSPRPAPIIETPVRLSKTPGTIRTLPPRLGEHTDAIMKELGFKDGEIADLRTKAII
jgi:crotonobetainyl-CoA:carnitine CoA-transferase CaiB-like acyl-CoA transferase